MAGAIKENIGGITVYLPTGAVEAVGRGLAQRLVSLRGARIGILDNSKEFADLVLAGLAAALQRDHGVERITFWRKAYLGVGSPFSREMAAGCDAVVNGVGH
jgi:hypothetical protein